ncbi:hypothetical protein TNCV_513281 [Trichonephila clavipes]|nr:hypothetical protein TNCV_513281 [Trichonephila clavipes]
MHGLNGSCSHLTSPESRIGVVCKTTIVCINSSMTFAAAWTLKLETMAAATLDVASQTGASSMTSFFQMNPVGIKRSGLLSPRTNGVGLQGGEQGANLVNVPMRGGWELESDPPIEFKGVGSEVDGGSQSPSIDGFSRP